MSNWKLTISGGRQKQRNLSKIGPILFVASFPFKFDKNLSKWTFPKFLKKLGSCLFLLTLFLLYHKVWFLLHYIISPGWEKFALEFGGEGRSSSKLSLWNGKSCLTLKTSDVRIWLGRFNGYALGLIFSRISNESIFLLESLLYSWAGIWSFAKIAQTKLSASNSTWRCLRSTLCLY